ncbi:Tripartite-type tricarboxylate transporter, receptor component TctC [Rhodoferax sp. OV413]|uniref:Bug family tripartite tricarboxylate transporter substrate binding protein n=1 Tax=Rhodoferax sp. OV413 TaxID=1855285 RepID=UPI00088A85AB|nr:tripartite tricarboxylate transporter substrate binding protein [Rhodoferax sp. OV413]SDP28228.1 Tripartite-type tricarboxylate transporter, receptor component TctC [Rhodoferax sp. OV413]
MHLPPFHATRRRLIAGGILASTLAAAGGLAQAADFPDRPLTLVAPYPAGGAADVLARILGKTLQDQLGQPVVVENKPGAGTAIGAAYVANAKPDGYTLLISSNSTFTLNPALQSKLAYDPVKGFDAVGMVGSVALALLVNPTVKASNVQQLVAAVKAKPDDFVYGSFGNGTSSNFAGAMFNSATGLKMTHVPYKGSAPLMTDLIGGQIPISFDTVVAASQQLKSGKVKVLAVATAKRSSVMPDVPTVAESGYPGFDMTAWLALVAPRGLPPAVKARLEKALAALMASPDTQEKMKLAGFEPAYSAIPDWAGMVSADIAKMRSIAEHSQIKIE